MRDLGHALPLGVPADHLAEAPGQSLGVFEVVLFEAPLGHLAQGVSRPLVGPRRGPQLLQLVPLGGQVVHDGPHRGVPPLAGEGLVHQGQSPSGLPGGESGPLLGHRRAGLGIPEVEHPAVGQLLAHEEPAQRPHHVVEASVAGEDAPMGQRHQGQRSSPRLHRPPGRQRRPHTPVAGFHRPLQQVVHAPISGLHHLMVLALLRDGQLVERQSSSGVADQVVARHRRLGAPVVFVQVAPGGLLGANDPVGPGVDGCLAVAGGVLRAHLGRGQRHPQ